MSAEVSTAAEASVSPGPMGSAELHRAVRELQARLEEFLKPDQYGFCQEAKVWLVSAEKTLAFIEDKLAPASE